MCSIDLDDNWIGTNEDPECLKRRGVSPNRDAPSKDAPINHIYRGSTEKKKIYSI